MTTFNQRCEAWHLARFPDADVFEVLGKLTEELGELAAEVGKFGKNNTHGSEDHEKLLGEAADMRITLGVLLKRYFGFDDDDLILATDTKLVTLETPGAHKASLLPKPYNGEDMVGD